MLFLSPIAAFHLNSLGRYLRTKSNIATSVWMFSSSYVDYIAVPSPSPVHITYQAIQYLFQRTKEWFENWFSSGAFLILSPHKRSGGGWKRPNYHRLLQSITPRFLNHLKLDMKIILLSRPNPKVGPACQNSKAFRDDSLQKMAILAIIGYNLLWIRPNYYHFL